MSHTGRWRGLGAGSSTHPAEAVDWALSEVRRRVQAGARRRRARRDGTHGLKLGFTRRARELALDRCGRGRGRGGRGERVVARALRRWRRDVRAASTRRGSSRGQRRRGVVRLARRRALAARVEVDELWRREAVVVAHTRRRSLLELVDLVAKRLALLGPSTLLEKRVSDTGRARTGAIASRETHEPRAAQTRPSTRRPPREVARWSSRPPAAPCARPFRRARPSLRL